MKAMDANKVSFLAPALACAMSITNLASAQNSAATDSTQEVLIRGAKVYTVSARGTLDNADVLVRGGKIAVVVEAGSQAPQVTAETKVVEAKGRALTPGMFAGLSHIGLEEISAESSTVDASLDLKAPAWDQKWRPEFDVTLAYNPRSAVIPVARIEGLTWTVLAPGSGDSIIAGQGAAVTLDGALEEGSRAALSGLAARLFVQLGGAAGKILGRQPRRCIYMLLDQAIGEARTSGPTGQDALLHVAEPDRAGTLSVRWTRRLRGRACRGHPRSARVRRTRNAASSR